MTEKHPPARRSSGNNLSTASAADDPLFEVVDYDEVYEVPQALRLRRADGESTAPEPPGPPVALPDLPVAQEVTDFDPVPRQRNLGAGWTAERQRVFIAALADTGVVIDAARAAGMSDNSAYKLRRAPGAESFALAWELAINQASRRLTDIAFDRAINGVEEPVHDRSGTCTHVRRKYNDRLLMFLLRHHSPHRYGHGIEKRVKLDQREAAARWQLGATDMPAALDALEDWSEEPAGGSAAGWPEMSNGSEEIPE